MTFAEEATELITLVFGPISPVHGIGEEVIASAEDRLKIRLPRVLWDYYRLVGRHREVSDGMNHLLTPSALYLSNGALVFAEENQGCFSAGILLDDLQAVDPPVREKDRGTQGWRLASGRLSCYLMVTFCWQACNSLPSVAQANVSPVQLARMRRELCWASFGAHPEADTVGLWGEKVAIVAFMEPHDLYIASHSDEMLESLGKKWDLKLSFC